MNSTTPQDLTAARHLMAGDWDADGTISIHLPDAVVTPLLEARGWRVETHEARRLKGATYNKYIAPDGVEYWERDEALALALVAEVTR